MPEATEHPLPDAALAELADDRPLVGDDERRRLERDGFVQLRGVLSPDTVAAVAAIVADVADRSAQREVPLARRGVYQQAFLQELNLWQRRADIRPLVFSARLGRLAADLLDAGGVRIYHDQALVKEAGGGRTPWHCDQYYWPVGTDRPLTVWIPLQDTPAEMGPLAFRAGSHRVDLGRELDISDESEARMRRHPRWRELAVHDEPFAAGDVSFHYGWTFHGAAPNATGRDRLVMTVIYLPDGTTLTEPTTSGQRFDRQIWLPDADVGAPIASWLNPLVWSRDGAHTAAEAALPEPGPFLGTFDLP